MVTASIAAVAVGVGKQDADLTDLLLLLVDGGLQCRDQCRQLGDPRLARVGGGGEDVGGRVRAGGV
eukprot:5445485-Prymnesium_polylepis.1